MADRGYIKYNPQPEAAYWLESAKNVIADYRDDWPLTVRQVFYRLVATYDFPKTETAYKQLIKIIARARRAQPITGEGIPFEAIRDDRGSTVDPLLFEGQEEFGTWLTEQVVEQFMLNRMEGQETVVELWCEAGGMIPIMTRMARPYGIKVSSGHGYDSVTAKHKLAIRARDRYKNEQRKTLVLHVGDFDGSGEDMSAVLHEDVLTMYYQWTKDWDGFQVKRVALTEQQVIDYDVITAPAKPSDSRTAKFVRNHPDLVDHLGSVDIAAQLEALTPPQLRELVTQTIEENVDMSAFSARIERETVVRDEIRNKLEEIDWSDSGE